MSHFQFETHFGYSENNKSDNPNAWMGLPKWQKHEYRETAIEVARF